MPDHLAATRGAAEMLGVLEQRLLQIIEAYPEARAAGGSSEVWKACGAILS